MLNISNQCTQYQPFTQRAWVPTATIYITMPCLPNADALIRCVQPGKDHLTDGISKFMSNVDYSPAPQAQCIRAQSRITSEDSSLNLTMVDQCTCDRLLPPWQHVHRCRTLKVKTHPSLPVIRLTEQVRSYFQLFSFNARRLAGFRRIRCHYRTLLPVTESIRKQA
jgi:hypothetical protein